MTESTFAAASSSHLHVRVLVIDDDDVDRERCARYLEHQNGMRADVVAVGSTDEAEDALRDSQFDCILVDHQMTDETGLDFAARHRGEGEPPIILLTGAGSETIATEALRVGVADYLTKASMTANALRRAIRNTVERSELRNSLRLQNQQLQQANDALQCRNGEIQRFYHTLSHELKTPLTAAREFVSLVCDGVAGDLNWQQREFLRHAISCCDQLSVHFNDLVDAVRVETGKLSLSRKLQRIDDVVVRAITSAASQALERQVTLSHAVASDLPAVSFDACRILQVLTNLLSNAIKAVQPGGCVRLSVDRPDPYQIRFAVADNGCGISAEHRERIFERLYQVSSHDEHGTASGLGLGLYISREIVSHHGGELKVDSEPGRGSTFYFSLPINHGDTAESEAP